MKWFLFILLYNIYVPVEPSFQRDFESREECMEVAEKYRKYNNVISIWCDPEVKLY